jgi:hypothetical protein
MTAAGRSEPTRDRAVRRSSGHDAAVVRPVASDRRGGRDGASEHKPYGPVYDVAPMRTGAHRDAATPRSFRTASDSNDLREQRKQLASNGSETTVMGALRRTI